MCSLCSTSSLYKFTNKPTGIYNLYFCNSRPEQILRTKFIIKQALQLYFLGMRIISICQFILIIGKPAVPKHKKILIINILNQAILVQKDQFSNTKAESPNMYSSIYRIASGVFQTCH